MSCLLCDKGYYREVHPDAEFAVHRYVEHVGFGGAAEVVSKCGNLPPKVHDNREDWERGPQTPAVDLTEMLVNPAVPPVSTGCAYCDEGRLGLHYHQETASNE